nr:hypothetical protein [uncultured Carboxylicivirga sp.]
MSDHEFNEQKTKLRLEAMEKEVNRLRSSSHKQSSKIGTLRKSMYFQLVFFVSLFSIFLFKGMIKLPGEAAIQKAPIQAQVIPVKDTIVKAPVVEKDTFEHIVYHTHKGAIPKENYDGILFAIQIGAYTSIDLDKYEGHLLGIKQDNYEGINQFTLGEFIEYNEAEEFLKVVRGMGFNDAFIMSFKNGRRIHIQNAIAMRMKEKAKEKEQATTETKETAEESEIDNQSLATTNSVSNTKESLVIPASSDGIRL